MGGTVGGAVWGTVGAVMGGEEEEGTGIGAGARAQGGRIKRTVSIRRSGRCRGGHGKPGEARGVRKVRTGVHAWQGGVAHQADVAAGEGLGGTSDLSDHS